MATAMAMATEEMVRAQKRVRWKRPPAVIELHEWRTKACML
jgi:hypothetical protein